MLYRDHGCRPQWIARSDRTGDSATSVAAQIHQSREPRWEAGVSCFATESVKLGNSPRSPCDIDRRAGLRSRSVGFGIAPSTTVATMSIRSGVPGLDWKGTVILGAMLIPNAAPAESTQIAKILSDSKHAGRIEAATRVTGNGWITSSTAPPLHIRSDIPIRRSVLHYLRSPAPTALGPAPTRDCI